MMSSCGKKSCGKNAAEPKMRQSSLTESYQKIPLSREEMNELTEEAIGIRMLWGEAHPDGRRDQEKPDVEPITFGIGIQAGRDQYNILRREEEKAKKSEPCESVELTDILLCHMVESDLALALPIEHFVYKYPTFAAPFFHLATKYLAAL